MRRRNRKKVPGFADLLIAIGVVLLWMPVLWSMRASVLQSREVAAARDAPASRTPAPGAPARPDAPRVMPKASIVIPRLRLNAAIVEETRESDLDRGPMHLAGTGLPGLPGNCCIAAHKEKWFRGLRRLAIGDTVAIRAEGRRYVYVITGHRIVRADNVSVLAETPTPTITLITCSGPAYFGHGNGRIIVTGKLTRTNRSIID